MADIQTKTFDTLVTEQATDIQGGSSGALVDFSIGSILRAIVEAYAAVAMWLQGLVLALLATTRAATSAGTDLDTWMADYGLARLGANYATGQATFARYTATAQAVVPIGAQIQTGDGSQQYLVALDTANTAYSALLGGYVLGAGIASVTVPIQAVSGGSAGNATAGSVNTLGQAIPGVDTVTNGADLANGSDAESDAALRIRFVEYLASLSKATKEAVAFAVTSVQTGITYSLVENQNYDGTAHLGYFYVVADDGSGEPSDSLISLIYAAVDAVRPICSTFGVFPPVVTSAAISLSVGVAAGADQNAAANAARTAVMTYVNGLGLGVSLSWSRLIQIAYDASPNITNVANLLINGTASDISVTAKQVVKASSVVVGTL